MTTPEMLPDSAGFRLAGTVMWILLLGLSTRPCTSAAVSWLRTGPQHRRPQPCLTRRHPAERRVSSSMQTLPGPGLRPPGYSTSRQSMAESLTTSGNSRLKVEEFRPCDGSWIRHKGMLSGQPHDHQDEFSSCG
jgi:hypothetical protein